MPVKYRDLEERLLANSVISEDTQHNGEPCWIWLGHLRPNGYGTINLYRDGRTQVRSAHRTSYEEFIGPIPEGYQIDHKCGVLACIHPNHLEPVPGLENIRRRDERRRAA